MTILFTDGSCVGNPGPGGWAYILMDEKGDVVQTSSGGYAGKTTNQRMELTAVIRGLREVKENIAVTIYTDSRYIADCFNNKWYDRWMKNNWVNFKGEPVANRDLWTLFVRLISTRYVQIQWIKGHSDNEWNNMCDEFAREEINRISRAVHMAKSISIDEITNM